MNTNMFCGALDSLFCSVEPNQEKVNGRSSSEERQEINFEDDSVPMNSKHLLPNHKRQRLSEKDKFQSRSRTKKMTTTRITRSSTISTIVSTNSSNNNKNDCVSTNSSFDDSTYEAQVLKTRFPMSTVQERKRFLSGRTLDRASDRMQSFMNWRDNYKLDDSHLLSLRHYDDLQIWNFAVSHAVSCYDTKVAHTSKRQRNVSRIGTCQMLLLPRIVKFGNDHQDYRANDGRRIALVHPALVDIRSAPLDLYAACIAVYLYMKLDRHSDENIHVLIDVRAGRGWPNPSPTVLIPFVKNLSKILVDNMPERMHSCILFPLPVAAKPIWGIFKTFLDRKVVGKMHILFGPASIDSKLPKGMEGDIIDAELLTQLEKARLLEFKPQP